MTKLFPLFLILTLLCGCAAQNPVSEVQPVSTELSTATEQASASLQPLQKLSETDALQSFVSSVPVHGILASGNNLILFSNADDTQLLAVDPVNLELIGWHNADIGLIPENVSVQNHTDGISYFHELDRQTIVLDHKLGELSRIDAPDDLTGTPLLSGDGTTLYYCTENSVRALNIETGISRILKETADSAQALTGLLLEDSVLQLSVTESDGTVQTLFLSAENGQLLQAVEGDIRPQTASDTFFLHRPNTGLTAILFGKAREETRILKPHNYDGTCFFLKNSGSVANLHTSSGRTLIDTYDLQSGSLYGQITIPGIQPLRYMEQTADGAIWFTAEEDSVFYRWQPAATPVFDDAAYAEPYRTQQEPDHNGLAVCSQYARNLSQKYGIEILVYKDAVALQPRDFQLEYESQPAVLQHELERLDCHLSNFSEGFLDTLSETFTSLTICLVQSVIGSPESGTPEEVGSTRFFQDFNAHIVLSTRHDTEYALYHELSHLMETVVLTESTAYDRWENLNPDTFRYDNDYTANRSRDGSPWLKPGNEYFVDVYSMSYAKEDRARLFEYAMTAGHEELFRSPNLQAKLKQLCTGIREAFGLERSTEAFLWEQYLFE